MQDNVFKNLFGVQSYPPKNSCRIDNEIGIKWRFSKIVPTVHKKGTVSYGKSVTYIDGCHAVVRINYSLVTSVKRQTQSDGY